MRRLEARRHEGQQLTVCQFTCLGLQRPAHGSVLHPMDAKRLIELKVTVPLPW